MKANLFVTGLAVVLLAGPAAAQTGYVFVDLDVAPELQTIDLSDGSTSTIGLTGVSGIEGLAVSPGGILYAATETTEEEDSLYTCDTVTGACTLVGSFGVDESFEDVGLAFTCDGRLFLTNLDDEDAVTAQFYELDPATGQATFLGDLSDNIVSLASRRGAAACSSGLYGIDKETPHQLYCIDPATPASVLLANLSADVGEEPAIEFDASGVLWSLPQENSGGLFQIDPVTGNVTDLGYGPPPLDEYAAMAITVPRCLTVAVIPTTSAWGLAALGLLIAAAGFVGLRRGRLGGPGQSRRPSNR